MEYILILFSRTFLHLHLNTKIEVNICSNLPFQMKKFHFQKKMQLYYSLDTYSKIQAE